MGRWKIQRIKCPHCHGSRKLNGQPCPYCGGKGFIAKKDKPPKKIERVSESELREMTRYANVSGLGKVRVISHEEAGEYHKQGRLDRSVTLNQVSKQWLKEHPGHEYVHWERGNNPKDRVLARIKPLKEQAPVMSMGPSSSVSGTGNIATTDPLIKKKPISRIKPFKSKFGSGGGEGY